MFIAGDWGTTRLRLFLCDGGTVLDSVSGPGIGMLTSSAAGSTVRGLITPWMARYGRLPLMLCGMVGSRNGWREVPYLPCPVDEQALISALLRFEGDDLEVTIVPGVSCRNRLGLPDLMRGEETQILGAWAQRPGLLHGTQFFCLPGTHTKWVVASHGSLREFGTAIPGEIYALLRDHSIIGRAVRDDGSDDPGDGFSCGLSAQLPADSGGLVHRLFSVRSRQLVDGATRAWALAYLSGLLIGSDVGYALQQFDAPRNVTIIGDTSLGGLYAQALRYRDVEVLALGGSECAIAGLETVYKKGVV